jgi:hypothetical protein
MHCEPLAKQRAQMGCSLLHLTLDAAQASQEARNLGLRSLSDADLGADVGDVRVGVVIVGVDAWLSTDMGDAHCDDV